MFTNIAKTSLLLTAQRHMSLVDIWDAAGSRWTTSFRERRATRRSRLALAPSSSTRTRMSS
eukprot:3446292-Rhodomonas_salina.2